MFEAIQNGDFDSDEDVSPSQPASTLPQPSSILPRLTSWLAERAKDKGKDLPLELQALWEKDRQKKAENKQKRALERALIAADPMAVHKGGKKGRKAMLAAARSAEDLPNRILNFVDLENQIRRFLEDIGGKDTMTLPPADKDTRKRVHELALAFNLKSQSKGKGESRYTTLVKTSKSGIGINEKKIRRIMREATGGIWQGPTGGARGKAVDLSKHREGEEVGKVGRPFPYLDDETSALTSLLLRVGRGQDRRVEHRVQDARGYGMGGRRPHWALEPRAGRTPYGDHEEDETGPGRNVLTGGIAFILGPLMWSSKAASSCKDICVDGSRRTSFVRE